VGRLAQQPPHSLDRDNKLRAADSCHSERAKDFQKYLRDVGGPNTLPMVGSPFTILGDALAQGTFQRSVMWNMSVGGSHIGNWTEGGVLFSRWAAMKGRLDDVGQEPSIILWQQGNNNSYPSS
jgi:hypothetical protein